MTDERRYDEDEARQIFDAAAGAASRTEPSTSAGSDGFTLAELQGIGMEVGLAPERIAEATAALEARRGALPRKKQLGLPVSVGHVVDLPRAPTDREWDLLVSALRETFGARGKVTTSGGIREWTNGNLHAYVEPQGGGYRLRLGTLSGRAVSLNRFGAIIGSFGAAMLVILALSGRLAEASAAPMMFALMAAGAVLSNAITLPGWARRREEQMAEIANRALAMLSGPPSDPDPQE